MAGRLSQITGDTSFAFPWLRDLSVSTCLRTCSGPINVNQPRLCILAEKSHNLLRRWNPIHVWMGVVCCIPHSAIRGLACNNSINIPLSFSINSIQIEIIQAFEGSYFASSKALAVGFSPFFGIRVRPTVQALLSPGGRLSLPRHGRRFLLLVCHFSCLVV